MRPADVPFDLGRLRWALKKVQRWAPYVDGLLLDDLAVVLDDYTPTEDEMEDIALRLRGHLIRLVNLALTSQVDQQDQKVAELVTTGRAIRCEALPGDHWHAVGHVRRMAWTVDQLLERLVANQCLKAAV
ncbi:hypothetical protein F7R91_33495 [Streptomyces luteolifulvus]|uniref:Uncharacterized protein n=1 Tax=Streptomyces luteolifulvus TaxID=2615112 RepID=A0A6H9URU5_9ACTN|nr:hypothetical protein F7R91_33495 [Streptomyces luteolifulvus]